tara:strand:- start:174 stop:323 length:150 start_codon:yes stop_codon:yes gene_type:complete
MRQFPSEPQSIMAAIVLAKSFKSVRVKESKPMMILMISNISHTPAIGAI